MVILVVILGWLQACIGNQDGNFLSDKSLVVEVVMYPPVECLVEHEKPKGHAKTCNLTNKENDKRIRIW